MACCGEKNYKKYLRLQLRDCQSTLQDLLSDSAAMWAAQNARALHSQASWLPTPPMVRTASQVTLDPLTSHTQDPFL